MDALWRFGVTARCAGLAIWMGFFLPWCGKLRGIDLATTDGLAELWLFPAAATALLLLPRLGWPVARALGELLLGLAVLGAVCYLGLRLGKARGIGIPVMAGGAAAAAAGAIAALVRRPWRPPPAPASPPPSGPGPVTGDDPRQ